MLSTLLYTDILALLVIILGVMNVITILRYRAHVFKDVNSSLGIVMDNRTGKVVRTFDHARHGNQWREVASEYASKLNKDHKRKR